MRASPVAVFAAGFITGGVVLGGIVAHAKIVTLNSAIAGVLPNSEGSLFCVDGASKLRAIRGVQRETSVTDGKGGGISIGTTLKCPS